MTFKAKAIPTMYAGVQFRSRLEARWAAMFDLLQWKWEYEPIDLDGYIPDFVLGFDKPMIVEVKPIVDWESWGCMSHEASQALSKIKKSGWAGEGLLVGAAFMPVKHAMGYVRTGTALNIGVIFNTTDDPDEAPVDDPDDCYANIFGIKECCGGPVDVVGYFKCRKCGHHDKGPTLRPSDEVIALWNRAGNAVQWKSPRPAAHVNQRHGRAISAKDSEPVPQEEVRAFFRSLLESLD